MPASHAPLGVLGLPVLRDVKVFHLARDLRRRQVGVESCERPNAALSVEQVLEEGVGIVAERGESPKTSDDHLRTKRRLRAVETGKQHGGGRTFFFMYVASDAVTAARLHGFTP